MNKNNDHRNHVETLHATSLPTATPTQPLHPYTKYKPSNIAWLGDIPEHWEVRRLGQVANFRRGSFPQPYGLAEWYDDINGFPFIQVFDVGNNMKVKSKTQRKISDKAKEKSVLVQKGTLILTIQGSIGRLAITDYEACIDRTLLIFQSYNLPTNIHYLKNIIAILFEFEEKKAVGSTIKTINKEKLSRFYLTIPPFTEQTAIANFLDYKSAKIDRFIQKKKQLIKLLNEQKAGIINDAVTKGIGRKDVACNVSTTKPSGIEWLGDIPPHWEVRKLKYVAESVFGKMLCNEDKGGYSKKPYLKSKNIQWLNVDVSDVEEMWFSDKELVQYRLNKGDLVISEGGEVGKTCLWNEEIEECYIQNSAHKVTVNNENLAEFYLYLFFLYGNKGAFDAITNKVSIGHLTKDKLINLKCLCPPIPEQTAIVSHIETETAIINKTIATIEKEIALVQEYRTAIIAEAVTGKIDVRDYEFSTIEEETYEELEEELSIAAEDEAEYKTQKAE